MAVITISRGSYSKGKDVAETVARRLGYRCISRDLLIEASEQFNIPEIRLIRALHDAPSVLERFTHGRERYLAYFETALLERVQRDNVVYHGLAGHLYLQGIRHVLNARIVADFEDRVRLEMSREGISRDEAAHILKKDDSERRQWSLRLFGVDPWDPSLYDLIIYIKKITVEDAAEIICSAVALENFQKTKESQEILDSRTLAAQVKAVIVQNYPHVTVTASGGTVTIAAGVDLSSGRRSAGQIQEMVEAARNVLGVKSVRVTAVNGDVIFHD
jgi:cytidylate kinase